MSTSVILPPSPGVIPPSPPVVILPQAGSPSPSFEDQPRTFDGGDPDFVRMTREDLLPLVDATVPVYPEMREPAVPGYQEILALSSVMLGYPDDELCDGRSEIVAALDAVPSSHPKTCLEHFARWWKDADPGQMRIHYVTTFDTRRGSALYVTYASCRDTALRGPALHAMKQLYTSYGYRPTEEELPDYLPTVCQFAALAPAEGALQALAMSYAGVEEIRDSLAAQKSPYSHILDAIASIIEKGVRS